jgi:hypothetical protein
MTQEDYTQPVAPQDELIPGRWYWVKQVDGDDWFPALHDPTRCGGWTNEDTWEDWDSEVNQWRLIPLPAPF